MEKKIVKRDVLAAIRTIAEELSEVTTVNDVTVTPQDIINYVDVTIAQIDKKNAKAKERNAAKKAENDELLEKIATIVGSEPVTIPAIMDALNDEDVTSAKVSARLAKLVKAGKVFKSKVKVDKRTLTAYSTVNPDADAEVNEEAE